MPGWLIVPLRILRLLLDWISDWVYGLIYDGSKADRIPPLSDVVLLDSAVTLADKIRRGSLSSEQIVKVFIKRIEEVNPTLNCIVDNRFEAALEESRQVDESLSRLTEEEKDSVFAVKPFLGVPFTAKDCFSVKGLSWSVGLKKRKDKKGDHDADSVRAMREAGAIPIGERSQVSFFLPR